MRDLKPTPNRFGTHANQFKQFEQLTEFRFRLRSPQGFRENVDDITRGKRGNGPRISIPGAILDNGFSRIGERITSCQKIQDNVRVKEDPLPIASYFDSSSSATISR